MDLFKAFDRISHDLLVAKLAAYGFEEKTLLYFVHLWKIKKKMFKNNNINNIFQTMASGASQGFIVRPILFNIFFYNVFFFLCNVCS